MNAATDRAVVSWPCAGSEDGLAFAVCDGQELLDLPVPGRLGASESMLANSQL
jgi:hypothetical protein